MKLGINIKTDANEVKLQRVTRESIVNVSVNTMKNKVLGVKTTVSFLDHMIETFAWRANLNIGAEFNSEKNLGHLTAEDTGIAIGMAILELYKLRIREGVEGFGYAQGAIDEAFADALISIEGRVNCFVDGPIFENVDGTSGYNLIAFLEGFSQGCKCTLRINFSGKDPHHCWESVFRALGLAIRKALEQNTWQKETISGMKGTLE